MVNWLSTSYLKESEKICNTCGTAFYGKETLHTKDDGNIWIKFVKCSRCDTVLVLDVVRHHEMVG